MYTSSPAEMPSNFARGDRRIAAISACGVRPKQYIDVDEM